MLRRLACLTLTTGVLLGATALPATAATGHSFTIPAVHGVKGWGSYTRSAHHVYARVCVQKTARNIYQAYAGIEAFRGTTKKTFKYDSTVSIAIRYGVVSCKSFSSPITNHLMVWSGSTPRKGVRGPVSGLKTLY
jgi:hypothetical protein